MLVVDQSSLDQVMADPNYQFKSSHFKFEGSMKGFFSNKKRFESMLVNDFAHMMPFERGDAVSPIQLALMRISGSEGLGKLNSPGNHEIENFEYGKEFQRMTTILKNRCRILNSWNKIDPIVGKKTIRALDYILYRNAE
jgi:hypothetical protein